jgi:hypothetical protein
VNDCEVTYDPEGGCVTMSWRRYAPEAFRASNERVLGALNETRADRLLGEIESLDHVAEGDLAWLARDWIPRAAQAGLRRVALVTPSFGLGHAGVLLVGEQVPASLELAYFDDRETARAWLTEDA